MYWTVSSRRLSENSAEAGNGTVLHLACLGGKGDWKYTRKATRLLMYSGVKHTEIQLMCS